MSRPQLRNLIAFQANVRRNQNALINELKIKTGGPSSKLKPDEVQDGTFETLLLGLKSEPYRTNVNEGMRKSFRRQRSDKLVSSSLESEAL